jgi:DNA-binding NarL/FixJ family response regulator
VLLDPYPLWIEAVEDVLSRAEIEVVGKTTDAAIAATLVEAEQPDVLVADIGIDDATIEQVRRVRERVPGMSVIAVSSSERPEHIEAAFAAGASAYVLKSAHPDDLTSAVRQLFGKSVYFAGRAPSPGRPETNGGDGVHLTRRELEILRLVAEGYSNGELAKMLWVTEQTVKFHLSNVYRKIGVSNRTEAGRWAQLHAVVASDGPPKHAASNGAS